MKIVDKIMIIKVVIVFEMVIFFEVKKIFDNYYFYYILVLDFDNKLKGIISKEDLVKVSYFFMFKIIGKMYI